MARMVESAARKLVWSNFVACNGNGLHQSNESRIELNLLMTNSPNSLTSNDLAARRSQKDESSSALTVVACPKVDAANVEWASCVISTMIVRKSTLSACGAVLSPYLTAN